MLPEKLRQYTARELEHRAAKLLAEQYQGSLEVPIDVEFVIETLPGVDLDVWRGLRQNHNLDGIVFRNPDTGSILIKIDEWLADQQGNRYRTTVAEELGHVVLHREIIDRIQTVDDFRELQNHPDYKHIERNAKRFAAAVLMPGHLILKEAQELYPRLVNVAGFTSVDAIKKHLCTGLAKRFEVSYAAMDFRLKEWPARVYERVENSMEAQLPYLA